MAGKKRQEPPVDVEEGDFPRGGREDLTPLEKRQLAQQAEADFKQEQAAEGSGSAQRKKAKHSRDKDGDFEGAMFSSAAVSGKLQHVEQLKYKSLCVGMKLWGCVLEVSPQSLIVSLPHGLRGTVAPADTSDVLAHLLDTNSKRGAALRAAMPKLHQQQQLQQQQGVVVAGVIVPSLVQLFSVGQYVRCVVKDLKGGEEEDAETAAADAGAGGTRRVKQGKRIILSLKLKSVLGPSAASGLVAGQVVPAVVKSVEDRGYSLSFGVKGVTGFLPSKDYSSYYGPDTPPLPGTLLDVIITQQQQSAAAAGVVQVSVALDAVAGGLLQNWEGLNMNNIMPGCLVNCRVRQVLSDGVLVSFGGFFHGAIDHFHLGAPLPEQDWQKRYQVGTKLQARILFIDPANKRLGLSCLPHLLNMRLPAAVPQMGQIFDAAVVARVDPGLGLLLRLPMEPEQGFGFAHVSNLVDGEGHVSKTDVVKKFPVGAAVRARVIGFRLVDGLCAVSLKQSVLQQQVYSVKDLYPGQHLDVTVLDQTPAGLVVQITQNLKALVPKIHMTDSGVLAEGSKLPSKLKPGRTLPARVLSVDSVHKRVQVTLKKGLVGSKLAVISDLRQASVGMKVHGVVTGVAAFGVFVGFYGGLSGLMPRAHLDLLAGQEPDDVYTVGQLIRCQVASVDMRKGKLVVKPSVKKSADTDEATTTAAAAGPWAGLDVGSIIAVGGVVQQVLQRTPEEGGGLLELSVTGPTGQSVLAHLPVSHLSDHPGGVEALLSVIKPGITLPGPLLVLKQRRLNPNHSQNRWQQQDDQQQQQGLAEGEWTAAVLVTRKPLLVAAAQQQRPKLPASTAEVTPGAILPGYVASISKDAVFVRFLGRCTGRAGIPQLADTFVTDPSRHFCAGQTVMAAVVAVEDADGKFAVSLKPSVVGSSEGKFLAGLMSDLELAYQLQQSSEAAAAAAAAGDGSSSGGEDETAAAAIDWSLFTPGNTVGASLHELKSYGAVMDLDDHPDVVGLVVPEHHQQQQTGGAAAGGQQQQQMKEGQHVTACVLDVAKTTGIIELSMLPELQHLAAAAAATGSSKKASKKVADGQQQQQQQSLLAAVGTKGQAVVQLIKDHYVVVSILQQQQQQQGKDKSSKSSKQEAAAAAGNLQQQQQQHIGIGFLARGDINSQGSAGKESRRFSRGQVVTVRIAAAAAADNGSRVLLELAEPLTAAAVAGKSKSKDKSAAAAAAPGGVVTATVVAVHELELEVVWGKSGSSGHIHVSELQDCLGEVPAHNPLNDYKVQQQLAAVWLGHVKGLGHKRGKETQLTARQEALEAARQGGDKVKVSPVLSVSDLHENIKVIGWVCGFTSDALWLSLAPEIKGRVHVLESGDAPDQLTIPFEERFSIGQAVAAVVLGVDPKHHTLDLSLRSDRLRRAITDPAAAAATSVAGNALPAGGDLIPGRVAAVSGSGVIVQLGSKLQGIVSLTDLNDDWVDNALAGIRTGVYVRARVLGPPGVKATPAKPLPALVDDKGRVLLSLRPRDGGIVAGRQQQQPSKSAAAAAIGLDYDGLLQIDQIKVGSKVQGYVRSVSTKGAFIALDRHHTARIKLSQLSDGFVEDPVAAFTVGTRVQARVLAVEHTKPPQQQQQGLAAAAVKSGFRVEDDGVRLELSLRSESSGQLRTIADIKEGELTGGKVRRIEKYGVFVELNRSRVSGLVHISQIAEGLVKDLPSRYTPGQAVTVRVLSVDRENNKINLSMKPDLLIGDDDEDRDGDLDRKGSAAAAAKRDFDDEMLDAMEVDDSNDHDGNDHDQIESGSDSDEDEEEGEESGSDASDVDMDDMDVNDEEDDDNDEDVDDVDEVEESDDDDADEDQDADQLVAPGLPAITAAAADWGELQLTDGATAADTAAAANGTNGELSKAQKKKLKVQHEAEIRAAEKARLAGESGPESAATYEQQLMAEPNSSFLWIKYMAFQLKLGEIDAARRIAERALSTIAMTEEIEKFNIWVALLNLENAYGGTNAEEAVMTVFKRAVQYVEPKKLYIALLGILERSGRYELAKDVWKTATKKFNTSCKVWLGAYESALQAVNRAAAGDDEEDGNAAAGGGNGTDAAAARSVLERALKSLPKHKHIKALTRAALAEFRIGCAERGRSLFESMLANYPKRVDLWNVYIDQEVKSSDMTRVRSLLARATSLQLPPKKMKVLFKRWLEFEQTHGSAADVANVRQKAVEYMEQQTAV